MKLLLLVFVVGVWLSARAAAQEANLGLSKAGSRAMADSVARDRWGRDGWWMHLLNDGLTAAAKGQALADAAWASDDHKVPHRAAVVFPRRAVLGKVVLHWGRAVYKSAQPIPLTVTVLRDGVWQEAHTRELAPDEAKTEVALEGVLADGVRVCDVPPEGVSSRRMALFEIEAFGAWAEPARGVNQDAVAAAFAEECARDRSAAYGRRLAAAMPTIMRKEKTEGFRGILSREGLERARQNAARYPWAKKLVDTYINTARWWAEQSDEFLWNLIPEGNPRALCPSFEFGCPIHGGARHTFATSLKHPFRWQCKKGGEWWGDGVSVKNPATVEEIVVRDNGKGWLAPQGFLRPGYRYYFTAAYRHHAICKAVAWPYEGDLGDDGAPSNGLAALARAYALTGQPRYAHKAGVLLSRIGQLYGTWDGCVESPSEYRDGGIGQFERSYSQTLIQACDLVWDGVKADAELAAFVARRGLPDRDGDGQFTARDVTLHLQQALLGGLYLYLQKMRPWMDGDYLIHENTALAMLARVLDNPVMMREALEDEYGVRVMLTNSWFRDGKFIYDASGYNVGNNTGILNGAEWFHGFCDGEVFKQPLDLYRDPQYRLAQLVLFNERHDCDGRVPQIGDTGGSRALRLRTGPAYSWLDERAYVRLTDRRDYYARKLWAASAGDVQKLREGTADEWLLAHGGDLAKPGDGTFTPPRSVVFHDSGIAILRHGDTPSAVRRMHVPLTYSKGSYAHGHTDKLAINIIARGYDWSADLGYPTTWTDIKGGGWEQSTASHATVMLDGRPQRGSTSGSLHLYHSWPGLSVVEASCEMAYSVPLYRRTLALLGPYLVDIFRVSGAKTRDYLFHSLGKPEDMAVQLRDSRAEWGRQPKGSLAGENVAPMTAGGYGFLFDLHRTRTDHGLTATWKPTAGSSQPDRYLLSRERYQDFDAEFTITRTGQASGPQERAAFAFGVDPGDVGNRRTFFLHAGSTLPIGQAIRFRVEVRGADVTLFRDGVKMPVKVDIAGAPPDEGAVGFLHYYNYAFLYDDFRLTPVGRSQGKPGIQDSFDAPLNPEVWQRIDPTYAVRDGRLLVRDGEDVGLALHALGAPGREVIRAKAEGYGVRGQSPLEAHLIQRQESADPAAGSRFVNVFEVFEGKPVLSGIRELPLDPATEPIPGLRAVALAIREGDRVHYVFSALDRKPLRRAEADGVRFEFAGRFGVVTLHAGRVESLRLLGGTRLVCGDAVLETPGSFLGIVERVDLEGNALLVRPEPGAGPSPTDAAGRTLLVSNPAWSVNSSYEIAGLEPAPDGLVRVRLAEMPLLVARGVVRSVDAENGSFSSATPVMKISYVPRIFEGKRVRARHASDAPEFALKFASGGPLVLADREAVRHFAPGGEYFIYDVGAGDRVEIPAAAQR